MNQRVSGHVRISPPERSTGLWSTRRVTPRALGQTPGPGKACVATLSVGPLLDALQVQLCVELLNIRLALI